MKLSIIIISFNTKKLTLECLESIKKTANFQNLEIIVVDNASTDGSSMAIKSNFSRIKLIQNTSNIGFSKANNQAINQAQGEYILLLNSDTLVQPQAIRNLIEFLDAHPQVGIAASQLLNPDGTIQPNGGFLPRLSNVLAWMLFLDDLPWIKNWFWSYQLRSPNRFKSTKPLGWVQGAAIALRQTMLQKIGLLDENIFMYGEDVEICFRAHQKHWQIWLVVDSKIIHQGFKSGSPKIAILGEFQGLKYIFQKHKPSWEFPILRIFLKLGALVRLIFFGTIFKDTQKYAIYKQVFSLA